MLLSKEDIFKKSLFKNASFSAPLLLLLRVLQGATFALWDPQDAEFASPSSPNLIRTKNEGR